MTSPRSSKAQPAENLSCNPDALTLVVSLSATASPRLVDDIARILNHTFKKPFTFLGSVGESFELDLHLSDPGLHATEVLARRLMKVRGVRKLNAERQCPRRGAIYAISLRSSA
mgnify:FL=1